LRFVGQLADLLDQKLAQQVVEEIDHQSNFPVTLVKQVSSGLFITGATGLLNCGR
jgi:hypothetical protein